MNTPENHNETDSMDSKKENKADDDASHTSSEHSANGERSEASTNEASTNTENDHGEASAHNSETNQSAAGDTSSDSDHNTENNTSSGADASTDIPPSQAAPPDSETADQSTPLVEVSAEQKAALKKVLASLKAMAAVMSLPLLTLGPILIIVGTLLPWSSYDVSEFVGFTYRPLFDQSGLGGVGGGYAILCFAIGVLLAMTTMRAMFFGFKHSGLLYQALALASFWSTIAYITLGHNESYGLWITLAGSVVTSLAFAMQGNMMPQKQKPSSEDQAAANPLATIENIIQAVIVGIAGLGAFFSGFAWDLVGNGKGFDSGVRFGVIIFVAGILILISTLLSLFNASSKEVFSFQPLWFLAGATITAVTLPTLITIIFFPFGPLLFLPVGVRSGLENLAAIGLWVALASGLVIMWQTRAVVRK